MSRSWRLAWVPGLLTSQQGLCGVGLHIFLEQRVDVAILEVGLGGRLDATNVVRSPAVCGIASLGFDHMEVRVPPLALHGTRDLTLQHPPGVGA